MYLLLFAFMLPSEIQFLIEDELKRNIEKNPLDYMHLNQLNMEYHDYLWKSMYKYVENEIQIKNDIFSLYVTIYVTKNCKRLRTWSYFIYSNDQNMKIIIPHSLVIYNIILDILKSRKISSKIITYFMSIS